MRILRDSMLARVVGLLAVCLVISQVPAGAAGVEGKLNINTATVKQLMMMPGIGKKTAERIVVELRDRIGAADALESASMPGGEEGDTAVFRDAVGALISLGYKQAEARAIVQKTVESDPEIETVEALIRRSLAR